MLLIQYLIPSLLSELERQEDRWVGDPTEKGLVVRVFCLGYFSQRASWCLQSPFFQFAALIKLATVFDCLGQL